jgi:hypothetical protein
MNYICQRNQRINISNLYITKPSLSPALFGHALFEEDELHHKIIYGKDTKISRFKAKYYDLAQEVSLVANTDFLGVKEPSLNNLIEDLQKQKNEFILVENDFESISKLFGNEFNPYVTLLKLFP